MKTLIIILSILIASTVMAADYTIKTDAQGELLLKKAVEDWQKTNTVTVNEVTKDKEGKEITTPTITVPKMNKAQFIQKLLDDKLAEVYTKIQGEEKSTLTEKWDSLTAAKKDQIKAILEAK